MAGLAITGEEPIKSSGMGTDVHNDLTGRNASNCHPINAITGLQTELQNIHNEIGAIVVPTDYIPEAPNDDKLYGRKNEAWEQIPDITGKMNLVPSATAGNLARFNSSGQVIDGGIFEDYEGVYRVVGNSASNPFIFEGKKRGLYYFVANELSFPSADYIHLKKDASKPNNHSINLENGMPLQIINEVVAGKEYLQNEIFAVIQNNRGGNYSFRNHNSNNTGLIMEVMPSSSIGVEGNQTKNGVVTFNNYPVLPINPPTNSQEAAPKYYVDAVNHRVDSIENRGLFVGSFSNFASVPTNKSGFIAIDVNDFITVREDESQDNMATRYICTTIDGSGDITWVIDFIYSTDITGKMDLVLPAVSGNAAVFDSSGQVIDVGLSPLGIYHVPSPIGLNESYPFILEGKKKGFYYFDISPTLPSQLFNLYIKARDDGGLTTNIQNAWKCVALEIIREVKTGVKETSRNAVIAFWNNYGFRKVYTLIDTITPSILMEESSSAELFVGKEGNQIINATKTFSNFPVLPTTDPTTVRQAAHKQYVDNTVSSGITTSSGTINARIDSLENKGLFVGAFDTKAMIPTNVSAFAAINVNDFVNVRADETQGGATTQYVATAISAGVITWTFNFKYSIDITGKMNLVPSALSGHVAKFNNLGQVVDGGVMPTVDRIPEIEKIRFKREEEELTVDFSKPLVLENGETAYLQYARFGRGSRNRASQFRWIQPEQKVNATDMANKGILKWVKIDITDTDAENGYVVIPTTTLNKLYFPPLIRGGMPKTWLQWSANRKGMRHNNDNDGEKYHRRDSKVFYKFRIVVDNGADRFYGKESVRTLKIQEYIQTGVNNSANLIRKYEIK